MTAQELADSLPDGVVVADGQGVVTLVSRLAASMLDLDGARGPGRPLAEVLRLTGSDAHDWVELNRPFEGLRTRTGVPEQSWLLPDGTEVLVSARIVRAAPLGEITSVTITLRSGRGRARLDRERSDLVATVAHELRSPLTGVRGFVQALLSRWDRLDDDQRKLMLTTVAADADRLSRLIAELLDVARIDTGRLQIHPRPVDAGELVARAVESVAAGTTRTVRLAVAPDLPPALADPDKLIQVVTNLIENAVRHGAGDVRVDVEPTAGAGALRIAVADEGEGIPPDLRRRVFTKFWTDTGGGSGLGLYIVNALVRAHEGTITVSDAPGGGALLVCTWPVAPGPGFPRSTGET
ncbi:sensor histidine kinase [Nocardioides sp. GXZ039]|uniref:sensor histidine kinase n=1 Tax=Nocardioides sp. GXZ039 TaxID=3136018 RepID=UPI0030F4604D